MLRTNSPLILVVTLAGVLALPGCGSDDPATPADEATAPPEETAPDDDSGDATDPEESPPQQDLDPYADDEYVFSGILAVVNGAIPAEALEAELAQGYEEATGLEARIECDADLPAETDASTECHALQADGTELDSIQAVTTAVDGDQAAYRWSPVETFGPTAPSQ